VGPDSAGANPGPACYRRNGPLTVTDANVLLGRIPVDHFPSVFGPDADEPLDAEAAKKTFSVLAKSISKDSGIDVTPEKVAAGFLTVAVESMANAIRKITIERGEDVRDFTLCCFGGAAGQHACAVAEALGMKRIWLHPMAGVLSAYGMGLSNLRVERQQSIEVPFNDDEISRLQAAIAELRQQCDDSLAAQNVPQENRAFDMSLGLRISGSDTILNVVYSDKAQMIESFSEVYRNRFGTEPDAGALLIATLRVEGTGIELVISDQLVETPLDPPAADSGSMWVDDRWCDIPVYEREALGPGTTIDGPAIIAEANGTTVIDAGWIGAINDKGHLLLDLISASQPEAVKEDTSPDPVRLEVFNRLFMHIAEQMGTVLQNTALSVNIRERLDFSCALFDDQGRLVSNAPHMPVHLGSMGESVRSVIAAKGSELKPRDAIMLNSPYNGGTHLPDITVVTPWFADSGKPLYFLASRAHHADIGGITPGSMPSESHHIDEEGVLIDNFWLVRGGEFRMDAVVELLSGAKYPARNQQQNIADLKAQLAANQQGIRQLEKAIERYGMSTVQNYLRFVRENATTSVRRLLGTLKDGEFEYELDSGEKINARITVDQANREATIDFAGTAPQSETNFNATPENQDSERQHTEPLLSRRGRRR
jgi:5-oxoprolinase (ATP-hydrolysing)